MGHCVIFLFFYLQLILNQITTADGFNKKRNIFYRMKNCMNFHSKIIAQNAEPQSGLL